ncbi:MAG: BamA/TamA family outer membrane protein [Bryobacteraceae bacterium]
MRKVFVLSVVAAALLHASGEPGGNPAPTENVNSRYTIESVEISQPARKKVSKNLLEDVQSLVGQKFDQLSIDRMADRLRKELQHFSVLTRVARGDLPEHVKVFFEASRRRMDEDTEVTKLAYHSKQGWTGGLEFDFDVKGNEFRFGVQSDADQLLERYAGLNMGYSRDIGDRVRLRFDFETFHQIWNPTTLRAAEVDGESRGIYRTRDNYAPSVVIMLTQNLSLTSGLSFQHLQFQFPAVQTRAANAVVNTLRYRRQWELSSTSGQELDAGYSLRAATNILDSDFVYARHLWHAGYLHKWNRNTVIVRFMAGYLTGTAPLLERYSLGNTSTLRGWNKFDVAPLGGSRMAHASTEYRYRVFGVFYDTGSVWDTDEPVVARHSIGASVGLNALKDGPYLAVAFPLRDGRFAPLFILSMNF